MCFQTPQLTSYGPKIKLLHYGMFMKKTILCCFMIRDPKDSSKNVEYYTWLIPTKICHILMYLELSRYIGYFVQESTLIFHASFLACQFLKIHSIRFERNLWIVEVHSVEIISVRSPKWQSYFQLNYISTLGEELSQGLERQNEHIHYRLKDWK